LHNHHSRLINKIHDLIRRAISFPPDVSLLISYCSEFLIPHATGEEHTLYLSLGDDVLRGRLTEEHGRLRKLLDDTRQSFARGDEGQIRANLGEFTALLDSHFEEEENILMPALMNKLGTEELESLIKQAHVIEENGRGGDIDSLFELDHKRIDLNIASLSSRKAGKNPPAEIFDRMKRQLVNHIDLEERILFPAFTDHSGIGPDGPVQVMVMEHRGIKEALRNTEEVVRSGDSFDQKLREVIGRLAVHNKKEELILYPSILRSLPGPERSRIFAECFEQMTSV